MTIKNGKKVQASGRPSRVIRILVAVLVLGASGIGITHLAKGYRRSVASSTTTSLVPAFVQHEGATQEITLRLNPDGFAATELMRGAGPFQLSVDNRSGVEELTLILSTSNGTQVRELKVPPGGGDWSEVLDLVPGSYRLTEAEHNDWVCSINVQ